MRTGRFVTTVLLAMVLAPVAPAQRNFDDVEIKTEKIADGIHMLVGAGGNLGVSVGEDGVFLIDDQYAPLTDRIRAAIAKIDDRPIRFVLNTHWHFDHTGGNENLGKAGTLIFAHDNVRERMSVEQFMAAFERKVPPSPKGALPVVTYSDTVTFHLNGEEIHAFHVEHAHTDGDSIVHFRRADVVHMGDVLFSGRYPFIDASSGGSIDGVLAALDRVLDLTGEGTRFIAGHGPVVDRREVIAYRDMLRTVRDRIAALIAEGKSREEIVAAKPTAPLDEVWGQGFLKPDKFVEIVYDGMRGRVQEGPGGP